jgi:cyclopropane fatty-acyl-phospholipid synthase-like methyltransferase
VNLGNLCGLNGARYAWGSEKVDLIGTIVAIVVILLLLAVTFWIVTGLLGAPWVPTSGETVNEMLSMAGVNSGEVVYDLGSGDGRIIIAAAKRFHAKSVGVELNPLWVLWTRLKVAVLGLRGKTKIIWGNFFNVDLSKADVVTLYLIQNSNDKLEPKLKEQLKPGSRVVSHVFTFYDWHPVKANTNSQIYLYIVK